MVVLAGATEEVSELEDSVAVAMARVVEDMVEEAVVVTALAFLEPQSAAFLQAR